MSDDPHTKDESLEEVILAFQRMTVPDRPSDAAALAQLVAYQSDKARSASNRSSSKRRYLMRLLVSSAAAALLLAGSLGLFLLNGTAPLAVADVVKSAKKHKLVRYQQQQTVFKEGNVSARIDSTFYADLTAARLRSESHVEKADGEALLVSVQNSVRQLVIDSGHKTAWLGHTPKDFKSFCCSLEEFEQKKGVTQLKDKLGDLATFKYHFEEGHQTSVLWVDAKSKLPVRMEQELTGPAPDITRTRLVWTDFEWDPELPTGFRNLDELFSTRPPEGYTLDDQTKEKKQK